MADLPMLGRLQASLAQATNEVTVAAANLNFDFCLVKYEAPKEYQPLGQLLSSRRKQDAELGKSHVTARRLAALFEGLCPETPNLTAAYGKRVSEISLSATDNASKEYSSSIFEAFSGVDATSIWAAATSSRDSKNNAMHVHLLACILTVWEPAEAVSIWVELVQERRRKIAKDLEDGSALPFSMAAAAAQQEITRAQLAEWDASARSWMQTANTTMVKKQTQLKLILGNLSLPVGKSNAVYGSVTEVWLASLLLMERLLSGMPQEVQNGSALLGLTTWHIYPDIVVFGSQTVEIRSADTLVPNGGVLSLGCTSSTTPPDSGIAWSLSLAHLRHYGHPVQKDASFLGDVSRLTVSELRQVVLGCVLELWGVNQEKQAITLDLLVHLSENAEKDDELDNTFRGASQFLKTAVEDFQRNQEAGQRLISVGRRRVGFFDQTPERDSTVHIRPRPYFGLLEGYNFLHLLRTEDEVIHYLRRVGERWKALKSTTPLIRFNYVVKNTYSNNAVEESSNVEEDGSEGEWIDSKDSSDGEEESSEGEWIDSKGNGPGEADFTTLFPIQNRVSSSSDTDSVKHTRWSAHQNPHSKYHDTQCYNSNTAFSESEYSSFVKKTPETPDGIASGRYSLIYGDTIIGGVFVPDEWKKSCEYQEPPEGLVSSTVSHEDVVWTVKHDFTDLRELMRRAPCDPLIKQIYILGSGLRAMNNIQQGIISIEVLRHPFMQYFWTDSLMKLVDKSLCKGVWGLGFGVGVQASIISYFAGVCNIHPDDISQNIAGISIGDSLIVPSRLLNDPAKTRSSPSFVRILGNIGQPGLVIFSSVQNPMLAKLDQPNWRVENHHLFNGKRENALGSTSMHLSFTNWERAIDQLKEQGTQDSQCRKMESVISIRENGRWIGDVDVIGALRSHKIYFMAAQPPCTHLPDAAPSRTMVSVESWEDLSDIPAGLVVVQAHGNWLARLAATTFLAQQADTGQSSIRRITVCPFRVCWQCHKPEFTSNVYIY